ncbi:MAG: hypothetical protein ABI193_11185 [Minicystis sp.]
MKRHVSPAPMIAGALACALHACTLSTGGLPGGVIGSGGATGSGVTIGSSSSTGSSTEGAGGAHDTTSAETSSSTSMDPGPYCADLIKNGTETDVDCGGDACGPCGAGKGCTTDGDCVTLACQGGACAENPVDPGCVVSDQPTCADCLVNGLETDIDCGGDACSPCGLGAACLGDADCATLVCEAGACVEGPIDPVCVAADDPTCNDCVLDGLETGIDCGGDACAPCGPGQSCLHDGDCTSGVCAGGLCSATL